MTAAALTWLLVTVQLVLVRAAALAAGAISTEIVLASAMTLRTAAARRRRPRILFVKPPASAFSFVFIKSFSTGVMNLKMRPARNPATQHEPQKARTDARPSPHQVRLSLPN